MKPTIHLQSYQCISILKKTTNSGGSPTYPPTPPPLPNYYFMASSGVDWCVTFIPQPKSKTLILQRSEVVNKHEACVRAASPGFWGVFTAVRESGAECVGLTVPMSQITRRINREPPSECHRYANLSCGAFFFFPVSIRLVVFQIIPLAWDL